MDVELAAGRGGGDAGPVEFGKVPERLLKRDQARREDAARRTEARQSQPVTEEQGESFVAAFNAERAAIDELLSSCSGSERAEATQTLEEATARIQQLQKLLNDSMVFLTQYRLKQAQDSLRKLQSTLAEKRDEVSPKKKFAFRARSKAKEMATEPALDTAPPSETAAGVEPGSVKVDGAVHPQQCGFSDMGGVVLTKTAEEIRKQDVLLTHLTNCKVRLFGSPSTLHIKHVTGCEILCGPVSSSVFVDHCSDSTLAFPCQQLRTHNTTDTRVYLHVTSRAIIEDCHGVCFAPFTWSYPTLEEDFGVSGLDQGRNNWTQVDDFNWLAAGTPSPNWSIIPVDDRKTSWDPEA